MNRLTSIAVKSLVAIVIGSGTLASNLQAQVDLSMTTSILFPFTVGTETIPPGTYQFSLSSSPFLLAVLNVKTGHEQVFFVRPEEQQNFSRTDALSSAAPKDAARSPKSISRAQTHSVK